MSAIYNAASSIYHWAFGGDPFLIEATPENLKRAILEKGQDVFQYKFKARSSTYSTVEYCVKLNDKTSMKKLIELGADAELNKSRLTPILHFYIDCLNDDEPADLEMLQLLLDHTDIDQEDIGMFYTPLEHLLAVEGRKGVMHFNVIRVLLQRGARISSDADTSAFKILKSSHNDKIWNGAFINRSAEEERIFLSNLVKYLELERQFHPLSESAMTLEEFQFHSQNLNRLFSYAAVSMDISAIVSTAASVCLKDPENLVSLTDDKKELFTSMAESLRRTEIHNQSQQAHQIIKDLSQYYFFFEKLCNAGAFIDCFEPQQLEILTAALKNAKAGTVSAQRTLKLMESLGLSEQNGTA